MDYKQMTAPCGLDCFNCPVYLAGKNEKLRNMIALKMQLPPEKCICSGCRGENGYCPVELFQGATKQCDVYGCIQKKGYSFCFECPDFPCDYLHPYADQAAIRPHNTKIFNLCLIKKMGVDNWAKDKSQKVKETYFKGKFQLFSKE